MYSSINIDRLFYCVSTVLYECYITVRIFPSSVEHASAQSDVLVGIVLLLSLPGTVLLHKEGDKKKRRTKKKKLVAPSEEEKVINVERAKVRMKKKPKQLKQTGEQKEMCKKETATRGQ